MENFKNLFLLPELDALDILKSVPFDKPKSSTSPARSAFHGNDSLLSEYSELNDFGQQAEKILRDIQDEFCQFTPNWESPYLHYNVGAPINVAAQLAYSIALQRNIFTINDGLSGNALIAEEAVVNIVSELAGLDCKKTTGWFTFGGTGINLYALKVGLKKALPNSATRGVSGPVKVFTSDTAHFGHLVAAEWLGIGTENVEVLPTNEDGTTSKEAFEVQFRSAVKEGIPVACIYLSGGTSYAHVIDDIEWFVIKRNEIISEYGLDYIPHIHVDSVIGWFWLFFREYNFDKNPLEINADTRISLKMQTERIAAIKLADSWGCDFHKGIGGCPVDSSVFILNNLEDAEHLSKKNQNNIAMHQIAEEFSQSSPVNYTLENSRSAGPMLSALASLKTMGRNGFRQYLGNLVASAQYLRSKVSKIPDMHVCDTYQLGFVVMLRIYPKTTDCALVGSDIIEDNERLVTINAYNKAFFEWDHKTRISKGSGVEYSYSSCFRKTPSGQNVHALKIYLMSPFLDTEWLDHCLNTIISQKDAFDLLEPMLPPRILT